MLSCTESRIRLAFVTRIVLSEPSGNRDERAFLTQTWYIKTAVSMIGLLGFSGFATCEPLFFVRPLDSTTLEDGWELNRKAVSGIMLTMPLSSTLSFTERSVSIRSNKASEWLIEAGAQMWADVFLIESNAVAASIKAAATAGVNAPTTSGKKSSSNFASLERRGYREKSREN